MSDTNSGNGYIVGSSLEKALRAGYFVATGELGPPQSADRHEIEHKAGFLKGIVESVNITDNQTAVVRMSSISVAVMLMELGIEPNIQMTARDRNRIAIQSDILGVSALGIRNMLCLSGDHQQFGNHPQAKNVFDIDSIQLVSLVKKMRDEGKFLNDEDIDVPPKLFIGAAANPFADPTEYRVYRLANKVDAGADFIQTQCIYNMDRFRQFMKQAVDMGVTENAYILAGVTPMKSAGMANYMSKFVPGMDVPESEEGIKFALEQIEEFKEMEGVAGVHLMAIEWEHRVPEIAERAKVLPRPKVE
jgi:methylenetetrahydrofolate reductase (NADPH)